MAIRRSWQNAATCKNGKLIFLRQCKEQRKKKKKSREGLEDRVILDYVRSKIAILNTPKLEGSLIIISKHNILYIVVMSPLSTVYCCTF